MKTVIVGLGGMLAGYGLAYAVASYRNQASAVNPFVPVVPPLPLQQQLPALPPVPPQIGPTRAVASSIATPSFINANLR